jgi:hypothetical protein
MAAAAAQPGRRKWRPFRSVLRGLLMPLASRHPVAALVIFLAGTHGVVIGLLYGLVCALNADESTSRLSAFGEGFAVGMATIAIVSFGFFFYHRKMFRRL